MELQKLSEVIKSKQEKYVSAIQFDCRKPETNNRGKNEKFRIHK